VTLFVIITNKNTGHSNFIVHLRTDDLLVIFCTRRHEFLYRLSRRHSPRSLSIISQQSWHAIIKVFSNELYPESMTTENVKRITLPRFIENISEKRTDSHTNAQSCSSRRTDFPDELLPWVTKPTNAQKCTKLSYITNTLSSYMFRPLLWPYSGKFITKDGYIEIL